MTIPYSFLIIFFVLQFVLTHWAIYKWFPKMGYDAWKSLIPFYSTWLFLKYFKRPWYWWVNYYIPFTGYVSWMGMMVDMARWIKKESLKDHFFASFFPGFYFPYLILKENPQPISFEEWRKYQKPQWREWVDSITFAVVLATLARTFYFEAFTIPTSSMERTLLRGDFLFVSKLAYGPRIPMTPLAVPFTHHTLPTTQFTKSYSEIVRLPYHRLPGLGKVKRYDPVVFNFPAGDTVVLEHQDQVYYQLVRDLGRDYIYRNFHVTHRPIDKRENYIKRCVGMPGDTLEIINTELHINGKPAFKPKGLQYAYTVKVKDVGLNERKLFKEDITHEKFQNQPSAINGEYTIIMTEEGVKKLKKYPNVVSITRQNKPKGYKYFVKTPIFPNHPDYDWTEDNFGPLWVPQKGATVKLTLKNLPLYERIITAYEHNKLELKGDEIYINGQKTDSYTFRQNYYFMMGDNRHNSQDSRFWGFVPEDHVVGKAVFIWLSLDPDFGLFDGKIRWNRLFKVVKSDE